MNRKILYFVILGTFFVNSCVPNKYIEMELTNDRKIYNHFKTDKESLRKIFGFNYSKRHNIYRFYVINPLYPDSPREIIELYQMVLSCYLVDKGQIIRIDTSQIDGNTINLYRRYVKLFDSLNCNYIENSLSEIKMGGGLVFSKDGTNNASENRLKISINWYYDLKKWNKLSQNYIRKNIDFNEGGDER
jgi:hypothetical protein